MILRSAGEQHPPPLVQLLQVPFSWCFVLYLCVLPVYYHLMQIQRVQPLLKAVTIYCLRHLKSFAFLQVTAEDGCQIYTSVRPNEIIES